MKPREQLSELLMEVVSIKRREVLGALKGEAISSPFRVLDYLEAALASLEIFNQTAALLAKSDEEIAVIRKENEEIWDRGFKRYQRERRRQPETGLYIPSTEFGGWYQGTPIFDETAAESEAQLKRHGL